jgi:hypothetical protein
MVCCGEVHILFPELPPCQSNEDLTLRYQCSGSRIGHMYLPEFYSYNPTEVPLNTRAWKLQERLSPRRLLDYGVPH